MRAPSFLRLLIGINMKKNISAYCLSQTAQRLMFNLGACALVMLIFASLAFAQVYKCTFKDEVTRQNKVVYSDSPCGKAEKQTLTAIQAKSQSNIQAQQTTQLAQANALDLAVTNAVLGRDFKLAKSLATTKEHWRLIAIAESEAAPQVLTVANSQPVVSREVECAQATHDFDYVSSTSWRDRELVAAKKSVMYATCGVSEPVVTRPFFVGQTFGGLNYGGLNTGRWPHRNHVNNQVRPYHGVSHHNHPQMYRHHNGRSQAWGGASLNYRSKHFGINVNSANVR
jgi:hypothetical protein